MYINALYFHPLLFLVITINNFRFLLPFYREETPFISIYSTYNTSIFIS